jgi:hypothetical protein
MIRQSGEKEMDYEDYILRRAEFVLNEARNNFLKRDIAITMTLRAVSNYLTVRKDGQSRNVKMANTKISLGADELKKILTKEYGAWNREAQHAWHKGTTNEHQMPLKWIWEILKKNARDMSASDLCDLLKKYPYVTVTNEENFRLNSKQAKSAKTPEDRYRIAEINLC